MPYRGRARVDVYHTKDVPQFTFCGGTSHIPCMESGSTTLSAIRIDRESSTPTCRLILVREATQLMRGRLCGGGAGQWWVATVAALLELGRGYDAVGVVFCAPDVDQRLVSMETSLGLKTHLHSSLWLHLPTRDFWWTYSLDMDSRSDHSIVY